MIKFVKMKNFSIIFLLIFFITSCNDNKYKLYFEIEHTNGLNIGDNINSSGLKVGEITNIELNKNNGVCVTAEYSKIIFLPIDSKFFIESTDLLGTKVVDIKLGTSSDLIKNRDTVKLDIKAAEHIQLLKEMAEELLSNNPIVNHLDSLQLLLENINTKLDKQSQK